MDYYYQSGNHNQNPPSNNNRPDAFSIASMVCGIIALVTCCTGFVSLIAGALGIIFAILSKRTNKPMHAFSITGICTSCAGLILGIVMIVYAFATTDFSSDYYNEIYEEIYGDYYDDYFDDYNDYGKYY